MLTRIAPRLLSVFAASFLLSACITNPQPGPAVAKLNPASIAASPDKWDGRQVEVVGLLVWESGGFGLHQDYGTYCRGAERAAIYVRWEDWPGVTKRDSRRRVMIRGVFRNRIGTKQQNGSTLVVVGALGPGPLEPGGVVSWLSPPQRPCPNRS